MNDEYLWQKTGKDPEIEKLENVLAVFRYREAAAPVPVVETTTQTAIATRWRMSFTFAFAASVMVVSLVAIGLVNIANKNDDSIVFVESPELEISIPPPAAVDEEKTTPAPNVVPQFAHSKPSQVIRTQPAKERRPKTKDIRPSSSIAALTEEEKYAYRQLMLALSISGSKLKIVKDTINGNENIENTTSNDQR